jgi:glycosyltransferase involved in cell wall biosynthesis
MNQQITIIYPATVDWYLLHQRPQQMLSAFAKMPNVRCIFVTTEVYQQLPSPTVEIEPDLFLIRNYIDYSSLIKGKTVFWFSFPNHYPTAYSTKYDLVVFDYIDNATGEFANWAEGVPGAISVADIVFCTADIMYARHKRDGKPIYMCPNGSDYEHFARAREPLEEPDDMPQYDEPVIGYYGAMSTWVDFELINKIAGKYKVVMIGNNKYYRHDIVHPNVVCLPHKDYGQLPYYLSRFNLAIVPFKLTEMIKGCDPIKFYEYLAAGKPVLSTEMVELEKYGGVTYFLNETNFEEVIKRAITEDNDERRDARQKVAFENSWESRARFAYDRIHQHLK